MRKRGSLNLSINAIVVLILAITMLGLGLAFMRNIFGGATEEFQQTTGEIEKQMIEQMKETNTEISLNRPKISIKIGDRQQIFLGLKNDQQNVVDYTITGITCNALGGASSLLSCTSGDVDIDYFEEPIEIVGGGVEVVPINIKVKTTANEGTCFCNIYISAVGEGTTEEKQTSLTIDVDV